MSVRVNLLPQATRERDRAAHQRNALFGAGLVLVLALGGAYWWASNEVTEARVVLAGEEARTAELRGEVDALGEFRTLEQRQREADQQLIDAMASEVSLAGVLQDVAIIMPTDSQLDSLNVTLGTGTQPGAAAETVPVGTFTATGQSLTAHAPGVERLLLELDKVVSIHDVYLNSSTLVDLEEPFVTFSLEGVFGPEAATGRYVDGLPTELR
jgi:hypothetical protein